MNEIKPMKLLFVCTGNICRSPTAEAVMRERLRARKLEHLFVLDSAGIQSYHIGSAPDLRTQAAASARGIIMKDLKARQISFQDFKDFDLIFAMDKSHYHWMRAMSPGADKVKLYLDFAGVPRPKEVPDPYHGEEKDFALVLDLIEHATDLLLMKLLRKAPDARL